MNPRRLTALVEAHPEATLAELGRRLRVSAPTVCRWLQGLGLPRKKNRCTPASKARRESKPCGQLGGGSAAVGIRKLVFVDESGLNVAMTRLYGRAPRGQHAIGSVPQNYGEPLTVLAALDRDGMRPA